MFEAKLSLLKSSLLKSSLLFAFFSLAISNSFAEAHDRPDSVLVISDAPSFDFGSVTVGSSTTHTFTLTNQGTQTAYLKRVTLELPFAFQTGGTCGAELQAGQSCTFVVSFSPSEARLYEGVIFIQYLMNPLAKNPIKGQAERLIQGVGAGACGLIGPWTTVDTQGAIDSPTSFVYAGLATSSTGAIFASGGDGSSWVIKRSLDRGATWQTVFSEPIFGIANAIDVSGNTVFAAGFRFGAGFGFDWSVYRSTDGGTTWQQVDQVSILNTNQATGVTIAPNGHVFVIGAVSDFGGAAHWIVRRSVDGGATWQTVEDDFDPADSISYRGRVIRAAADGTLISGGWIGGDRWVMKRSVDDGATWQVIDTFIPFGADTDEANVSGLAIDSLGNIVATGTAFDFATSKTHWFTRASQLSNATTWTTLDDVTFVSDDIALEGGGVTITSDQHVFVSNTDGNRYITREGRLTPGSFSDSDTFIDNPDVGKGHGNAAVLTLEGDVLTAGALESAQTGVIRRLENTCAVP